MSWWGGGDIKVTPGVECLNFAISSVTLNPGNWPPSPGFAPCAILISISLQLLRYLSVTQNLAEAICLTLELALSPFFILVNLFSSSPPSPLQEAPLILFIPIAKVSCASFDNAP